MDHTHKKPLIPGQTHPIDPRITARTRFFFDPVPPPPLITARIRFNFDGCLPSSDLSNLKRSRAHSPQPEPKNKKARTEVSPDISDEDNHNEVPEPGDEEEDEDSEDDDIEDDDESDEGESTGRKTKAKLIPKPPGQPGKPNSGGFSIDKELASWGGDLPLFKAFLKKTALAELNPAKSFRAQDKEKIKVVRRLVRKAFPIVKKYVRQWPSKEELKMVLKYSVVKAAKKNGKGK